MLRKGKSLSYKHLQAIWKINIVEDIMEDIKTAIKEWGGGYLEDLPEKN